MSIHTTPLEIQWNIISRLSYPDIMNYCESHSVFKHICSDDGFWKYKFAYDSGLLNFGDTTLNPQSYANAYKNFNEQWSDTYRRWYIAQTADFIHVNETNFIYILPLNLDIILFRLDQEFYTLYTPSGQSDGSKTLKLCKLAVKHHQTLLVQALYTKYTVLGETLANFAIMYSALDILEWLTNQGVILTHHMCTEAHRRGQTNVIQWMLDHGFCLS
jgi:hypothetical protein